MRFKTLSDWLQWQESLHSSEIDMGLDRVRAVAERLDLLSPTAKVVTVAGTNGKGSCVTTLQTLLSASNANVVSYTSPHLQVYNERIRIDGQPVSDEIICRAFDRIDQARSDISLTYFEFGTLAAIDVAVQLHADYLVLEVGLGGRLDAVNIVDADISVVTSIAQDHESWLGTDLDVIGWEKAGIFRKGRPAICASPDVPTSVAAHAKDVGAKYIAVDEAYYWSFKGDMWQWSGKTAMNEPVEYVDLPVPSLPMPSVAAALQVFTLLGYELTPAHMILLAGLSLPGRSQRIMIDGVTFILDVAHNPAASQFLADQLIKTPAQKTLAVIAMMADKDCTAVLGHLKPVVDEWFFSGLSDNPRAATASELVKALGLGDAGNVAQVEAVSVGIDLALAQAFKGDRVVIMGSFFTVAEALSHMERMRSRVSGKAKL